jgi:hypothetical protein
MQAVVAQSALDVGRQRGGHPPQWPFWQNQAKYINDFNVI